MKRLYVRPHARGQSIGRALAERLIQEAVRLGYSTMLLDTLDRLKMAMQLYETLGFVRIPPYYNNPLAGVVYWKRDL
jgi:GNAT superfamily N-acetyltransferase